MNQYSEMDLAPTAKRIPTPSPPKTRKAQATRQRQLDAAEALFGEKGYYDTSIVDITQRANVALGTFYVYFPSKLAIFSELVISLSNALRAELRRATASLSRRQDIERIGLQSFFAFVRKHRNLYRIVQQAELVDQKLYRWYYQRLAKGYASGLAAAMGKGELRRLDPECLAYCLMGVGHFLGMRWVLWEDRSVPQDDFEAALQFIYHGILKNGN
jgi:AcrR family transcriptional regulator